MAQIAFKMRLILRQGGAMGGAGNRRQAGSYDLEWAGARVGLGAGGVR